MLHRSDLRKTALSLSIVSLTLIMASSLTAGTALAQSSPLNIQIDRSQRISLRGAAGSVIVANPAIADVTVVDANTLFITGKGYGSTEVVAVDQLGRTLFHNQVIVTAPTTGAVRVWRGAQATEMSCAGSCMPSIRNDASASSTPTP